MKLSRIAMTSLAAGAVFSVATASHAANLLSNAGFESGDFSGWTVGGNTPNGNGVGTNGQSLCCGYYGGSAVQVRSGTYAAYGQAASSLGQYLDLSQTLNLAAGNFTVGMYYGSNQGPFGNFSEILLDGVSIASVGGSPYIESGFQLLSGAFSLASDGVHTITYRLNGSGTVNVAISADDFYLDGAAAVPEPASLGLLGLGAAGLGFLRRRKKPA